MPKELEQKLMREANTKGLSGKHKAAYVYGTMRKTGWVPSTQQVGKALDKVARKKKKS